MSVAASAAAEIVLLPIAASVFSRATCAGVVLNLLAVPLMTIAQVGGLVVVAGGGVEGIGHASGTVAAWAAIFLVESARLIDLLPWLAIRVPRPSLVVVVVYYAALGATLWLPAKRSCALVAGLCAVLILTGATPHVRVPGAPGRMRLTAFDVGQGDALLLQTPRGRTMMIDSGGAGFNSAAFDIGGRVLTPALWAHGVRRLDVLAITHGDPDHVGGAAALFHDLAPRELWEGVVVPRHAPTRIVRDLAVRDDVPAVQQVAGGTVRLDDFSIRVLHPPLPDWERQKVRNDDSLVLEVRYGDVAILLTGDISSEVERAILPQLTPARIRVLKVAHHGSRTSTSEDLLRSWQPHIAVISCGRDNRFGHPAPEVIKRLRAAGVRVYRTDLHGQITVEATTTAVHVRTFGGGAQ
jgi:competence protein ComEC